PLLRFLVLDNPPPQPAAPDTTLAFTVEPLPDSAARAWVGPVWLTGEGAPVVVVADGRSVATADGRGVGAFPGGAAGTAPSPAGVVAADLDYDYRTDLVLAGAGGLRLLRQTDKGFADATADAKLSPAVRDAPAYGAWAADLDTDGDLDLLLAPVDGPP